MELKPEEIDRQQALEWVKEALADDRITHRQYARMLEILGGYTVGDFVYDEVIRAIRRLREVEAR